MTEQNPNTPATIPEQPDAKPPLKKSMPVVIALVAILAILGIANVTSLLRGNKKTAPTSALPMRPASPSAQQVSSFETQQQLQAQHDAEEKQRQQELLAAMQQFQNAEGTPGPGVDQRRADDSGAARCDLRREFQCAAAHLECLGGAGRSQAAGAGA